MYTKEKVKLRENIIGIKAMSVKKIKKTRVKITQRKTDMGELRGTSAKKP